MVKGHRYCHFYSIYYIYFTNFQQKELKSKSILKMLPLFDFEQARLISHKDIFTEFKHILKMLLVIMQVGGELTAFI